MKKGFSILILIISLIFFMPILTGCDSFIEMFYTEESTQVVTRKKASKTTTSKDNKSSSEVDNKTTKSNQTTEKKTTISTEKYTGTEFNNTRNTTTTYIKKTTYETIGTTKLQYSTTHSDCEHTEQTYDGNQYPQFTYYGYDGGIVCTKCHNALDLNLIEPYGRILFSHNEYIEGENGSTISDYTILINEDDANTSIYRNGNEIDKTVEYRFTLVKNAYYNGTYKISYYTGKMSVYDEDTYVLKYDGALRNNEYAKFKTNEFTFVDASGNSSSYIVKEKAVDSHITYVPRKGNSDYGYDFLSNYENKVYLKSLFYDYYKLAEGIYNSDYDIPSIFGDYMINIIDTRRYDLSYDEILGVWNVFCNTSPMYFFMSNQFKIMNGTLPLFLIDSLYATKSARELAKTNLNNIINTVSENITDLGETATAKDKIKLINDYLCNNLEYAWQDTEKTIPEDHTWAHSVSGLLLYNKGVCECYSKSFLILCLNNDIDALIVTGKANNEGHSWNVVNVNNKWYGVDVTWNDQETGIIYNYLCASKSVINENRVIDDYLKLSISYQYMIPELEETGLSFSK